MTLNNVLNRIKTICLAHKQIRSFYRGFSTDLLADHTRKYPAAFLEDSGGSISTDGHATTLNFRLSLWDLVNVSEDTKTNEQDVDSDMVSIAMDIVAQMNYAGWDDWKLSTDNKLELTISEVNADAYGGCSIDFQLRIMFKQNICAVPSELFYVPGASDGGLITQLDLKLVYDLLYTATGAEGLTLTLPALAGKKILFITKESTPIYKVSNSPDALEYTWDDLNIVLGAAAVIGDRFLILYRNY